MYKTLILSKENGVSTITLNRPEVMNAFNRKLTEEFTSAVNEVAGDTLTRVLVITGAGRGFCVGGDLKDFPVNHNDVGELKGVNLERERERYT